MNNSRQLSGIRAVVFDVFGTLAEIGEKRRPYAQLMELLRATGRQPQLNDATRLMSANVGLAGVPQLFGAEVPFMAISALELELYAELASIKLFPETLQTLTTLRSAGYKVALCSNLAAPYAIPIKLLLPSDLDAYVWSFEVGVVKPQAAIYQNVCMSLACSPNQVLMIGDTLEADYLGPRQVGMQAFHLSRKESSPVAESIKTLDEILPMLV